MTRSPSTSHPAALSSSSASGASRKSMPTCSRIVSALCSIVARPSSLSTSNGVSVRVRNGTCSATEASRAAARPSRPPVRRRRGAADSSLMCCSSRDRMTCVCGVADGRRVARERGVGRSTTLGQPRERVGGVRDAHRPDEVLLESRLHGGLDLLDAAHDRPRSRSRAARFNRAMRAPVPAAFPALVTCSGSQSGTSPSTSACTGSMCAPNAPASRMRSTVSIPNASISSRQPA